MVAIARYLISAKRLSCVNYCKLVGVLVPDCYLTPVSWNTCGHASRFIQLQTNIDAYKYSFYPSAIRLWNALPTYMIEAKSLDDFQKHLLS